MTIDDGGNGGGVMTMTSPPPQQSAPQMQRRCRSMSETEQKERRASIQAILRDQNQTPAERRHSIQQLMDGRRRSSFVTSRASAGFGSSMAAAAEEVAAAFHDSGSLEGSEDSPRAEGTDVGAAGSSRRSSAFASTAGAGADDDASFLLTVDGPTASAVGNSSAREMEQTRPECDHYERKCTLISPCCGLAFGCRICHDDCPALPPPIFMRNKEEEEEEEEDEGDVRRWSEVAGGMNDKEVKQHRFAYGRRMTSLRASSHEENTRYKFDRISSSLPTTSSLPTSLHEWETEHKIDRFAVKEVICRECFTRQSSKTNNCIKCNIQFGEYHCSICNLWMTADEDPYHCHDCGFCRVGGRDNHKHCHDCGVCIEARLFDDHGCCKSTGRYMSDCPVCRENLFSSRHASHEMPCGHAIHWHCFQDLVSYDTRCPVCKKTAETRERMIPKWRNMAVSVALQPIPPDMARVVTIICNDCNKQDSDRGWHFLGVQCRDCESFNTAIESTRLIGEEAAAFLANGDKTGAVSAALAASWVVAHAAPSVEEGEGVITAPSAGEDAPSPATDRGASAPFDAAVESIQRAGNEPVAMAAMTTTAVLGVGGVVAQLTSRTEEGAAAVVPTAAMGVEVSAGEEDVIPSTTDRGTSVGDVARPRDEPDDRHPGIQHAEGGSQDEMEAVEVSLRNIEMVDDNNVSSLLRTEARRFNDTMIRIHF